jgi:hypothetical protein
VVAAQRITLFSVEGIIKNFFIILSNHLLNLILIVVHIDQVFYEILHYQVLLLFGGL